jgi:hypothetical protein
MKRIVGGLGRLAMVVALFGAASVSATTYYIAANGSDSNNGTSKNTPWLHAPGMTGCSGTCASTTPEPGDNFIFRGGDSWHYNSASGSPVGLPWTWNWSGSPTNCQLNAAAGTVVKTSCIYIGVDQSWFEGSSWTRPILNMDNPPTNSRPASCTYDQTSVNAVEISNHSYLILDNFENLGECWTGNTNSNFIDSQGTQFEVSNSYFHGWTYASSSSSDNYGQLGGNTPRSSFMLCDHNVFDGSDSSLGNQANKASGMALYNACTEIAFNVFNRVSNGCICNPLSVHDNLFQYLYEPTGSTHGNIVEWNNENYSLPNVLYFYNNIIHDTNEGEGINLQMVTSPAYVFNNVSWLYRENPNGTNGTDGSNCLQLSVATSSTIYYFNNTLDFPCSVTGASSGGSTVNNFQNNHLIGYSAQNLSSLLSSSGTTVNDNANEVYQSESAANGQGYVPSNAYAPTNKSGATVGAGANLSSGLCSNVSNPIAASACQSGVGSITYDSTNHVVIAAAGTSRPSSGAWDAGAHQFSSAAVSGQPTPPSGLAATVQ